MAKADKHQATALVVYAKSSLQAFLSSSGSFQLQFIFSPFFNREHIKHLSKILI